MVEAEEVDASSLRLPIEELGNSGIKGLRNWGLGNFALEFLNSQFAIPKFLDPSEAPAGGTQCPRHWEGWGQEVKKWASVFHSHFGLHLNLCRTLEDSVKTATSSSFDSVFQVLDTA